MNLLLDTHVLLWWLAASKNLSREARQAVLAGERVFVSAATVWEISIKVARGKLRVQGDLEEHLRINRFHPLPVTVAHALAAGALPRHHGDPFDRMLVAQAVIESLTLVTADKRQAAYEVPVILV
ncbi:MAG TPA: type II toxin-antitoxin system VapC family toxin [Bryobacteraceae bacterium]|nr:type II toxin-antitoxin system VapC family toxin [Bryobacteraceae bacterium]